MRNAIQRVGIVFLSFLLFFTTAAQSPPPKKKIKNFGSSLKRLRWDENKKELVLDKSNSKGDASDEEDVIRIESSLVAWDVLVVDEAGKNVRGLTADNFAISEDGIPQTVGHFLLGDNQTVPRSIVLIIDYSGSQMPYIRKSIDAAKVLVDSLGPLDRMAIVTDDVELILDYTDNKKEMKKKLESLIERTQRGPGFLGFGRDRQLGKSSQYSALMATFNEMFDDQDRRPIIIFQTDGDEIYHLRDAIITFSIPPDLPDETRQNYDRYQLQRQLWLDEKRTVFSLADLYRAAEKSRATLYTVIPGPQLVGVDPQVRIERVKADMIRSRDAVLSRLSSDDRKRAEQRNEEVWRPFSPANLKAKTSEMYTVQLALAALAPRTGGWTDFLETPDQASQIYSRILSDINQRYVIGYYPTNKEHDGKRRSIKVVVKGHPEYTIVGRKSYYAPLDSQ
jgi:VWFA-related protein